MTIDERVARRVPPHHRHADRRRARCGDRQRGPERSRRRDGGGDPRRVAPAPRGVLPRPATRQRSRSWPSPGASASRSSTRSSAASTTIPEIIAVKKLPTRDRQLRRHLALRHHLPRRAADGNDAALPRDPAVRRRHDVRQPVRRLRGAVAGDAARCSIRSRGIASSALADVSKTREDRMPRRRYGRRGTSCTRRRIRSCARIPRPVARPCTSTSPTRRASTGMTEEESAPLLQFLFQHQVKPEFTCRFVWERRLARAVGQPLRPAQPGQRLPRLSRG